MTTNVLSLARVLTVAAAIFPAVCDAQDGFPTRPVRFVVPFPAATPPDFLARIASQKLAESWGVPVIVEVRDGAGGTIGVNQVVRAIPDGYTLLFTNDLSIAIAPVLSKTPYDPRKDLSPIGAVAQGTSVLVMHPSAGVSSIKELIALGVTGTRPSPVIPEVMPISEQGLPEVIVSTWYAAFAPSGTPPAVLDKIRDALKKVFDD